MLHDLNDIIPEAIRFTSFNIMFKRLTGDTFAALLLQELNFSSPKDGRPFIIFNKPCNHPKYIPLTSWYEKFEESPKVVKRCLDLIAQKVKPNDIKRSDVFVWYWRDRSNATYYQVNSEYFLKRVNQYFQVDRETHLLKMYKDVDDATKKKVQKVLNRVQGETAVQIIPNTGKKGAKPESTKRIFAEMPKPPSDNHVKNKINKNREFYNSFDSKTLFLVEDLFTFTVDTKISNAIKRDNPLLLSGFTELKKRFEVKDNVITLSSTSKPLTEIIEEIIKRGWKNKLTTYNFLTLLHVIGKFGEGKVLHMLKRYDPKNQVKNEVRHHINYFLTFKRESQIFPILKQLYPSSKAPNKPIKRLSLNFRG